MSEALATQAQVTSQNVLDARELLNLDAAHNFLASRVRVRTPAGASEYLSLRSLYPPEAYRKRIEVAVAVCDIYRELFPIHYGASAAPAYSLHREQEFYVLCDRHIIPLGDVKEKIRRRPSFFMPTIPVKSQQEHDWRQGAFDFRAIETGFKLAQILSGRAWTLTGGHCWRDYAATFGVVCQPPAPMLGAVGWQLFHYACHVESSPMKYLPLAFHVTNLSTQTVFLDLPKGAYFHFEWGKQQVAKLMLHRRRATAIMASVQALHDWLDEAPAERIAAAVGLWNHASEVEALSGFGHVEVETGEILVFPELHGLFEQMMEVVDGDRNE